MRVVTFRLPFHSLFSKVGLMTCLALWATLGTVKDILRQEEIDYIDSPWEEWMDKKMHRPPREKNITYARLQNDIEFPDWRPARLQELLEQPTSTCLRLANLGGSYSCKDCHTCSVDGNKYICFDPDVAPAPGDCLIYSFGVGFELSWDTAMTVYNCSVFAFDMTMKKWDNGMITENLHFLEIGLGAENADADMQMYNETHPNQRVHKKSFFRTLETVRDILGHNTRPIDVLKLDIEFSEWEFFEGVFESPEKAKVLEDVKQIALEIHLDDLKDFTAATRVKGGQRVEKILEDLKKHGFHLVHTELNSSFQVFADVRGAVLPLFRESLYVRRP